MNYLLIEDTIPGYFSDMFLGGSISGIKANNVLEKERKTLIIPKGLESGDYYICLITDATDKITEDNENNNMAFARIHLIISQSLMQEIIGQCKQTNR